MATASSNAAAVILLLFACAGCASHDAVSKPGDTVYNAAAVDAHDGQRVSVRGIYSLFDARKHAVDEPPVYDGHVALILEDGTRVLLESLYSPEAIRSDDEIARFAGRVVVVTGILTKVPPPQPDHPQDVVVPCLSKIEEVRLAAP